MSAPARRNPLAAASDITLADAGSGNHPATLPIAQIRRDGNTQPRQGMDEDAVNDYANALRNSERLPPVDVMFDGSVHWLFDGFHRTEAHLRAGLADIPVIIHRGSLEDAQWRSFGANKGHGLRRSNADKERAVRAALRHSTGAGLSNVQIAKHIGVDDKTVARYRAEMETTSEIPRLSTRTGADGKERKAPPAPTRTPYATVAAAVRGWFNDYRDWLNRDPVTVLQAARHANAPSRADLEKALTAMGIIWRRQELVQIIDNLRIETEARISNQAPTPPQPSPGPAAPAADPAVPLFPPSPSMPPDLAALGWELRQIGGVGKWWCHNRSGSRATATHERAEEAIAEARGMAGRAAPAAVAEPAPEEITLRVRLLGSEGERRAMYTWLAGLDGVTLAGLIQDLYLTSTGEI